MAIEYKSGFCCISFKSIIASSLDIALNFHMRENLGHKTPLILSIFHSIFQVRKSMLI